MQFNEGFIQIRKSFEELKPEDQSLPCRLRGKSFYSGQVYY